MPMAMAVTAINKLIPPLTRKAAGRNSGSGNRPKVPCPVVNDVGMFLILTCGRRLGDRPLQEKMTNPGNAILQSSWMQRSSASLQTFVTGTNANSNPALRGEFLLPPAQKMCPTAPSTSQFPEVCAYPFYRSQEQIP